MNEPARPDVPTPAERLLSVLIATPSLTLRPPGHDAELVKRHQVLDGGRIRVELPADNCMTRHLVGDGRQPAVIETTDLVPVPVRDRIRSRASLTGSPAPADVATDDGELIADFDVLSGELTTSGQTLTVDPATLQAARPDPWPPWRSGCCATSPTATST
ncbi:hypothetical protein GR925_21205 [Streptomyces sp. HUCO-GS316]|uniref:hypothetical protein n=1 Tax=Streptomyces sp. HUCO-GS316 TaxID=2692198 RepID=UPI0013711493|nr:hypothetical protein [Streptomyces sp. HUCO-GS316]MXM65897.1 hypothetical protein [Streptomyces sp. HUCO-GS316]